MPPPPAAASAPAAPPAPAPSSEPSLSTEGECVKRKNQSEVWDHFVKLKNPDGTKVAKPRAKCKYCPQTYACDPKTNGTTSMRTHMLYQCKKCPVYIPSKRQKHLSFETLDQGGKLVARAWDTVECRRACARMIVRDELPFSHVEGEGFIKFMKIASPKFDPPSRRTISKDIWDIYQMEKEKIREFLARNNMRVSLTTDTWTSVQNINYLVLTAHFIDDTWTLHKRILNFAVIPDHKGKTIGTLVESCLLDWGIERVFSIVVDNASSNQVALDYIKEKIGNWNCLLLGGSFMHVRCCCHVLNLIVRDGMEELDNSIDAIRNAVKYIRSSPARLDRFRKCAIREKVEHKGGVVPLDVCTRWNSTYFMLDVAIKYRKAFSRLADEDQLYDAYFSEKVGGKQRVGPPKREDWEKAASLVKHVKIFYYATLSFSGT